MKTTILLLIVVFSNLLFSEGNSKTGRIFVTRDESRKTILQQDDFRLPSSIWPINYKLEMLTVLDAIPPQHSRFTAPGKAWITVNCSEELFVITMHAINLTINSNTVAVKNVLTSVTIPTTGVSYTEEYDFLHIELGNRTEIGQLYEIYIEFLAPISGDRLNGMYQDFYEDPPGETRYIATTLFAPYHTRRAFPCFDEPSFRATYDITLGHHTKYHAMSNAEIIDTRPIENLPGWQWDTFAKTPSISSYITAMIVSDLIYEEGPPGGFRNVSVRIYAKPQSIQQGAGTYSAKLVGDVMTLFESLFIVPYPISKISSVALPQFFFNAMENWGLITYKEPILLYVEGETTEDERYRINYVVSHEKAHQYFGNLVACKWWAYVWLKEGFATYYSHHGINQTHPELRPWQQFIPRVLHVAMTFDSTNATHPLENFPPTSPAVADIYTRIPYEKGASILRMTTSMITYPVFLSGVQGYVNTFQYKSAEQNDVFEQLQVAVNNSPLISSLLPATVKNILDSWTTQSGYPILRVSVNTTGLQISQEKFIDGDISNPTATWWVPVFISPRPNASLPVDYPDSWVPQFVNTVTVNMPTDQIIIVDPASVGYYRVHYQGKMFNRIVNQLRVDHKIFSASTRSKLLNDYASFAMAGSSEFEDLFELTSYLNTELDSIVWQGLAPFLEKMSKMLLTSDIYSSFNEYFGQKVVDALKLLEETTSPGYLEVGEKAMLRSLLSNLACNMGEAFCIERSTSLVHEWLMNPELNSGILLSLQEASLCSSIAHDDTSATVGGKIYKKIFEIYQKNGAYSPNRSRWLKALTCSNNKQALRSFLELVKLETSELSETEKVDVLHSLANMPLGKDVVLEELRTSSRLIDILEGGGNLGTFLDNLTSYQLSDEDIALLQNISLTASTQHQPIFARTIRRAFDTRDLIEKITIPITNCLRRHNAP